MTQDLKTLILLPLVLLTAIAQPLRGALPELTAAEDKFTNYLGALDKKHTADMSEWARDYRNALEAFVQRSQQGGKLEDLLRGKEEVARFEKVPVLTPRLAQAMKGDLRVLVEEYSAHADGTLRAHNASLVSLFQSYSSSLERLESHLTTEGSIGAAVEVRQARSSCLDDDVLRCAQFELAAANLNSPGGGDFTERPVAQDPRQDPRVDPAVEPPARTDEMAPQPKMETIHGVTVYNAGSPDREHGVSFKRMVMNRTPNAPVRPKWSISGQMARKETSSPSGSYMTKIFGWRLRVSIKALLGQNGTQNVMLVAQYYNKPAVGRGKIEPRLAKTRRTPLSLVAGSTVLLDYPSFDVWTARVKGGSAYGEEYYGVVISVFNAEGELEYQGATVRGFDELAATSLPGATPEESKFAMMAEVDAARRDIESIEWRQRKESKGERSVRDYMRMQEAAWRLRKLKETLDRLGNGE